MKFLRATRLDQHFISQWWWTIDRWMLAGVCALFMIGMTLVMAASPAVAERIGSDYSHFIMRHILVMGPAFIMMITLSFMSERQIWRAGTIALLLTLICMVLVLFLGTEIKGAQRWLALPGFSLQPSEFVKPAFAVFAAWLIARQKEQNAFPGNVLAAIVYVTIITLLMLQPDLGMSFVVTLIFAAQIFLAGLPFRYMLGFLVVGVVALACAYIVFPHVHSRMNRFLDPDSGDTYQIEKSIEAIKNGGLTGTGPGQGTVKMRLPDAHADFIFSVGAEEFGFGFAVLLIGLYGFIIWRGVQHLTSANNIFVILAGGGLLTMFGLQALIHMGSAMSLLPTKGMTLPFISYGGSSMLSMGFGFGILLALTRRSRKTSISRTSLSGTPRAERLWS